MAENIDDFSLMVFSDSWFLQIVQVDMAVKHILWFEFLQEPAKTGKSPVAGIFFVLQMAGRGVGQEDVKVSAIS